MLRLAAVDQCTTLPFIRWDAHTEHISWSKLDMIVSFLSLQTARQEAHALINAPIYVMDFVCAHKVGTEQWSARIRHHLVGRRRGATVIVCDCVWAAHNTTHTLDTGQLHRFAAAIVLVSLGSALQPLSSLSYLSLPEPHYRWTASEIAGQTFFSIAHFFGEDPVSSGSKDDICAHLHVQKVWVNCCLFSVSFANTLLHAICQWVHSYQGGKRRLEQQCSLLSLLSFLSFSVRELMQSRHLIAVDCNQNSLIRFRFRFCLCLFPLHIRCLLPSISVLARRRSD